ncbi:hypothetical protein EYF80_022078 [Liparis tanakae]|uniref:Uncharacterized protein n=1 Tax=Liparis tanakae TaxID=230148 RepID=A0A4Z2HS04_9TELE|nr:hypothetical protein EYF80_022078 [Liparis tanakae]
MVLWQCHESPQPSLLRTQWPLSPEAFWDRTAQLEPDTAPHWEVDRGCDKRPLGGSLVQTSVLTLSWSQTSRRGPVVAAPGVPGGRGVRERRGPARRPPPVRAVALAVQALAAARPLLLAHPLPLHGLSQEAVVVVVSPAPGGVGGVRAVPVQGHQVVAAAAASAREAPVAPAVCSAAVLGGGGAAPAVVDVAVVPAAGAAAPAVGQPGSPSPASELLRAPLRRGVVAVVAPSDVVEVVHGASAHAIPHVAPAVPRAVVAAPALLGHAADGAHGFVPVVDGGQRRRLGATPAAPSVRTVVQGADFGHGIH